MGEGPPGGEDGSSLRHCPARGAPAHGTWQDMDALGLSLSVLHPESHSICRGEKNVNLIPCSLSSLS